MDPPAVAVPPVPRRTCTVRLPEVYEPRSSPVASVSVPVPAPLMILREPGTKSIPEASTSDDTDCRAGFPPPLFVVTV